MKKSELKALIKECIRDLNELGMVGDLNDAVDALANDITSQLRHSTGARSDTIEKLMKKYKIKYSGGYPHLDTLIKQLTQMDEKLFRNLEKAVKSTPHPNYDDMHKKLMKKKKDKNKGK